MKRLAALIICGLFLTVLCACGTSVSSQTPKSTHSASESTKAYESETVYAHIGENVFEITLCDNSSARAFYELCQKGDVEVDMHDYGGFEKVGDLGARLVTNDENITTEPGDVILYEGDKITLYYGENTWNFTCLGKIKGATREKMLSVLGDGNVKVIFSLKK